jgi:hypothetical protein
MAMADRRPKLTLVRPLNGEYDEANEYERVGQVATPDISVSGSEARAELAVFRRAEARRRCNFILRVLVVSTLTTGIIGVFSVARLAWIGTALFAVATLVLIGLIGYARELELERRRQHRRSAGPAYYKEMVDSYATGQAEAGFPGAWDDELEVYPGQIAVSR